MSIVEKILSLINWAIFLIGSGFALGVGFGIAWRMLGLGKNHIEVNFPKNINLLYKAEAKEEVEE